MTLKDHKENCTNRASLPCQLINPSKSELAKVSKIKLEKINQALGKHSQPMEKLKDCIERFKGIDNKKDCIFIKFDIQELYLSVSESILKNSILFAKNTIL